MANMTNTNTEGKLKESLTSRTDTGVLNSSKQYSYLKDPSMSMGMNLIQDKEFYKATLERIKVAISKFSTSRKTKLVHELMVKNQIHFGQLNVEVPVETIYKENTLHKLFINPFAVLNYGGSGRMDSFKKIIYELVQTINSIKATKTLITSQQLLKIDSLEKTKKELIEKFMAEIDWLKVVDLSYFGLLQFYAVNATNKNKPEKVKVYKTTEDLLLKQLRKILSRVDSSLKPAIKTETEEDIKTEKDIKIIKLRLAVQFMMLTYFLQMSNKSAIEILKNNKSEFVRISLDALFPEADPKSTSSTNYEDKIKHENMITKGEETTEYYEKVLKDFAKFKPEKFENFAKLLEILDILKMNESTFKLLMIQNVGEKEYYNYYTFLPKMIALFCTLNYNSQLFPDLFEIDVKLQKRLEELVINQKSMTLIKDNKII
jgi:hypothetical protein